MNYKIVTTVGILLLIVLAVVVLNANSNPIQKTKAQPPQQSQNEMFKKGEQLYQANCIACHDAKMTQIATAPPLGGITKKREQQWLYDYTRNPNAPRFKKDPIVAAIRAKGWGLMTSSPHLTQADLQAIYYYIEARYEMTLKGIPVKP